MKFRLATMAYVFALLAAGMATFGGWGIAVAAWVGVTWACFYGKSRRVRELWLSTSLAAAFVCLFVLLPSAGSHRPALRNSCMNNMKQIMLGLLNYEAAHGAFPPPYVADANGKPMHSWRVLILPYMEYAPLFNRYRMDEPWDGPKNRLLWDHMPDVYRCPGCEACERLGVQPFGKMPANATSYFAIIGENVGWSAERPKTLKELGAGGKSTLMVMEHGGKSSPWTAPIDLTAEEAVAALSRSDVPGHPTPRRTWFSTTVTQEGRNAGTSDGHVRYLRSRLGEKDARALIAIGGADVDETATIEAESTAWLSRRRYERIYGVAFFAALALWPGVRLRRRMKKPPV